MQLTDNRFYFILFPNFNYINYTWKAPNFTIAQGTQKVHLHYFKGIWTSLGNRTKGRPSKPIFFAAINTLDQQRSLLCNYFCY